MPLSVEEAVDAVRGTWFETALATRRERARRHGTAAARSRDGLPGAGGARAPGSTPPVLSWDGVSVEFDGKRAVDDVTLAVRRG